MKKYLLLSAMFVMATCVSANSQLSIDKPAKSELAFNYPDLVNQLNVIPFPSQMDEQTLEELYYRFYQHYKSFLGPNPTKEVTYDWLMNEENARISFELRYLFELAHDKGMDVSRFEIFGFKTRANGDVEYDYERSRYLVDPINLLLILTEKDYLASFTDKLLAMGLIKKDIEALLAFAAKTHYSKVNNTYVYYLQHYLLSIANSMKNTVQHKYTLAPEHYQSLLTRQRFAHKFLRFEMWRYVGINLLAQFAKREQRIIKAFLIEQAKASGSRSNEDYYQEIKTLEHDIKSGKWIKTVKKRANNYSNKELLQ